MPLGAKRALLRSPAISPLLDGLATSPYAACGAALLLSSYGTGPLFRVVRSSDSATQDFSADPMTRRASKADILTFLAGSVGRVDIVYDQTGNSRNWTQTTSSLRPVINLADAHPYFSFPAGSYMSWAATAAAQNLGGFSIAGIRRYAHPANSCSVVHLSINGGTGARAQMVSNGTISTVGGRRLDADVSFLFPASGFTATTNWEAEIGRLDHTNDIVYGNLDTSTPQTRTPFQGAGNTSNTASTSVTVGHSAALSQAFDGDLVYLALFQAKLSDADTTALISRSLAFKPQIQSQLLVTLANGGQGVYADGSNIYFGKHNGDGNPGRVYKYTYAGSAVTDFAAPEHAATIDERLDNGTLIVGTGGVATPGMQEITKTGTLVDTWDFNGIDYDNGSGVCYKTTATIFLFTSSAISPYDFKIREITISGGGGFVEGDMWSATGLGVPQGLIYRNGTFYYLADDLVVGTLGTLYTVPLPPGGGAVSPSVVARSIFGLEREGLTHDGTSFMFGTAALEVLRLYIL